MDRVGDARGRLHREDECSSTASCYATWRDGRARHPAYLDDYANLLDGLLALLQVRWRDADTAFAKSLADTVLARFYDNDGGGFYFTAHDHERLIHRPKPSIDDAMPPGNGVLARALNLLGHLLGETRYLDAASGTLKWARGAMEQYPAGHSTLLSALEDELHPPELVIVRGPRAELESWLRPVRTGYRPWRHAFGIPYEDVGVMPAYLPRLVSAEKQRQCTAYVCSGLSCSLPIHSQAGARGRAARRRVPKMTLTVIGAGFGRTGTLSLKLALEQLGFGPCYHMVEVFETPLASRWWVDAADGDTRLGQDLRGLQRLRRLARRHLLRRARATRYPDAKVILTERDPEAWFRLDASDDLPARDAARHRRAVRPDVPQGHRPPVRQPHARPRSRHRRVQPPQRGGASDASRPIDCSSTKSRKDGSRCAASSMSPIPDDADAEDEYAREEFGERVSAPPAKQAD